ncbi:uncharacterized protein LTR77_007488 [Saxophila tyrrhenica]|uniref:Uncharacterized protein n=1 Tax=Saxophila tyrrhenica TaxID=1690608 RepID=A0AAV9P4P3_9PEZI|nr:hypothetical protein LTR77_007488 [Saxophila tyrrhenica]
MPGVTSAQQKTAIAEFSEVTGMRDQKAAAKVLKQYGWRVSDAVNADGFGGLEEERHGWIWNTGSLDMERKRERGASGELMKAWIQREEHGIRFWHVRTLEHCLA